LAEAKLNLTKLIKERKDLACELAKYEEELALAGNNADDDDDDECAPPSSKRLLTEQGVSHFAGQENGNKTARAELKERIGRVKDELECKSMQINDIQQMILEGDQEDKMKQMFNKILTMLEAKVLLKHLFTSSVQYLLDSKLKQIDFDNNSASNH
jgi:hypothetical protein